MCIGCEVDGTRSIRGVLSVKGNGTSVMGNGTSVMELTDIWKLFTAA